MEKNTKKKSNFFNFIFKINIFWVNIVVTVAVFAICASQMIVTKNVWGLTLTIIILTLLIALNVFIIIMRRKRAKKMATALGIVDEGSELCSGIVGEFKIPAFIISESSRLLWNNEAFEKVIEEDNQKPGSVAGGIYKTHLQSKFNEEFVTQASEIVKVGKRSYKLYANLVKGVEVNAEGEQAIFVYLVDVSGVERLKNLYTTRRIVIGEIIIDNYDEIFQADGEAIAAQVQVEVKNIFDEWLKEKNAIVCRLVRERYLFICESRTLEQIKSERFDILEEAKKISVGNTIPATLSIGISTNKSNLTNEAFEALINGEVNSEIYRNAFMDTLKDHLETSENLINLCLNRGGDQAAVRNSEKPSDSQFFGGSEFEKSREDKVAVRVTADRLKQEILNSDRVIIMGHRYADLDAIGSALALYRTATELGKPAYIVLEGSNAQIDYAYKDIMNSGFYEGVFIKKNEALNILNDDSLLMVCDTFAPVQCEAPELVTAAKRIGVIDHHRRGVDFIKETRFNFTDTLASSTSELMVEIMWYLFKDNVLNRVEAEMLYGGILVDTKNLYFKTGKTTFDVVGYLRELGASPLVVRKYVQPDYQDYLKINEIIGSMQVQTLPYKGEIRGIAFAECEMTSDEANKLGSIAADKMLEFNGVECSFVLVKMGDNVAIKARSPGEINVQTILENSAINGGGHLTAAAGIVKNTTVKEVKSLILQIIKANG